jgi:protein-S-isoprenylcysteine O-methyltransferase Ste14
MSKYLLLVLINLPIVLIGVVRTITRYKTKPARISRNKAVIEVVFWLLIGVGLSFVEPFYNTLLRHNLTDSPPMSLFDVALLTLFVFALLLIVEANEEMTSLKRTVTRLHEKLAIVEALEYEQEKKKKRAE